MSDLIYKMEIDVSPADIRALWTALQRTHTQVQAVQEEGFDVGHDVELYADLITRLEQAIDELLAQDLEREFQEIKDRKLNECTNN